MGMTYKFMVAKKGTIPEDQDRDDNTGWTQVGAEMNKEGWVFLSINYNASRANVEALLARLNQLDTDVRNILAVESIDIGFRRRLAKALVESIYGVREYHYDYPKAYYEPGSYEIENFTDEEWSNQDGSRFVRDVLTELLPYTNGDYYIKCYEI